MSDVSKDMALEALLKTAEEIAPLLPRQAVNQAYLIGQAFQFEASRDASIRELTKLADDYAGESSQ